MKRLIALAAILGCTQVQAAPILQVENGIINGAKYIDVAGSYYDVEFITGTCAAVFTGCDTYQDFTFNTAIAASEASWALLDQVLIGPYDDHPNLLRGCSDTFSCEILTPYQRSNYQRATFINRAINYTGISDDVVVEAGLDNDVIGWLDIGWTTYWTFARWTPSEGLPPIVSAVPEPGVFALVLVGLLGGLVGRSKTTKLQPGEST